MNDDVISNMRRLIAVIANHTPPHRVMVVREDGSIWILWAHVKLCILVFGWGFEFRPLKDPTFERMSYNASEEEFSLILEKYTT